MLTPNYNRKTLHVAVAIQGKEDVDRGIIYLPELVYSGLNSTSESYYENFFKRRGKFSLVPVVTCQDTVELARTLEENFGVKRTRWIGGVIALFNATAEQSKELITDLRDNPEKYYASLIHSMK